MKRGLRLFGHPVHPLLTDFPAALWSISLLWDLLGLGLGDAHWYELSFWCIAAGLGMAMPAAVTGFLDFVAIPRDHAAERVAIRHMLAVFASASAYGGSLAARGGPASPPEGLALALGLSVAGLVLLVVGGWLGGELVFRHGLGVDRRSDQGRR